jgi:hypothetical protein
MNGPIFLPTQGQGDSIALYFNRYIYYDKTNSRVNWRCKRYGEKDKPCPAKIQTNVPGYLGLYNVQVDTTNDAHNHEVLLYF